MIVAAVMLLILIFLFCVLVGLHLSSRIDALYARQDRFEEDMRYAVSCGWRYTEAVDDAGSDGAGTRLYLSRLSADQAGSGQPARH